MATFGLAFEAVPLPAPEQGRGSAEAEGKDRRLGRERRVWAVELLGVCFCSTFPGSLDSLL